MFTASQALAAPQYNLQCDDCHQMPPLDSLTGEREPDTGAFRGNHQTHAVATPNSCTKCHGAQVTTTGHRDGIIQVQQNLNGRTGASYSRGFFNQTSVPPAVLGTCSNVNCHFETTTPEWGITALDTPDATNCGVCHQAAPDSYAHSQHLALYGSELSVCAKCHNDHTQNAKPFQHATSAGRNIAVTVGSYAGSNFAYLPSQSATRVLGSCSNLYCHSSGQNATGGPLGAGDYTTPNWGNSASGACGTCHRTSTLASGSHSRHLASNGDCGNCHVNASVSAYVSPTHADGSIDVGLGSYDKGGAPGNGYGQCSTASCHASPYSASSTTSPVWGTSAGCSACHNGIGLFAGNGAPATGSHNSHMSLVGSACNQCHDGAVKNSNGGLSHANGTVEVANDYTGTPVAKHAPGTYTGTCLTASCHADPYSQGALESPVWGSNTGCASCHKGAGAFTADGSPATGSHQKHLAQPGTGCDKCHNGATSGVSGGLTHANGTVEVANSYTASPVAKHPIGTYAGTCSASCHNDGNGVQAQTPVWGGSMAANCSGCHGGAAGLATASMATGKHRSHMNNYTTMGRDNNLMCAECHAKTVSLASNTLVTGTGHLNSFKDYSGVRAGGSASYSGGICSNAYCHSSGQQVPVFVSMTGQKTWGGSGKLGCNGCHGKSGGATWTSAAGAPNYANKYDGTLKTANSHEKHTSTMVDSRGCANCHNSTVDLGVASKMRDYSSNHVNRVRDVEFRLGGSYTEAGKTCSTYCHSNVQAPGGNGLATTFGNPAWGANGSTNCASCHKNMSTLQETVDDLNLGSHKRHTVDGGYSCSLCHGSGYTASTTAATHADGTINLSFSAKATGTTYSQQVDNTPGDGYGTCSTSTCHGRATRNWGVSTTLVTCEKCHGSANTAQTAATFKDTAGSPASPYVGTHVSHLAGSHNYSNPITCDQCHAVPATPDAAGHMDGLPATLTWGSLATHPSIAGGVEGSAMVPGYVAAGRVCNNTYCHAGLRKPSDGTAQGTGSSPSWNDPAYLGGTGCNKCHMNPPAYPHTSSTNCSACHNHVAQSNVAFIDKSKHLNGTIEVTVDDCLGCHSSINVCNQSDPTCINKELIGAHSKHTDAELFLAGKKLSSGDYIDTSWIYSIEYKDGFPKYGCGFCHPMDSGTHKNGTVELDLDPSHSLAGTVKTKNKTAGPWIQSYTMGSNVVCSNVYCHSNGFVSETTSQYQFQTTPNWYATNPWANVDRCSQCHGNSPNTGGKEGSAAHARHVVGNHYTDIFDGYSSKIAAAGAPGSGAAHGDPATSTTFNCNLCHNATVTVSFNDKGSVCSSCHVTAGSAPLKGNLQVLATNQTHINGDVDVVFMSPFTIKSKAQLRTGIDTVQSVYTSWTRVNGYKTATSYDQARTTPSYVGGTCSTVACHNGTQMEWRTKGPLTCAACHVGLPQ